MPRPRWSVLCALYLPARNYRIHYAKSMQYPQILPPEKTKTKTNTIITGPGP